MKFYSEVKINTIKDKISYNDSLLFLGSCFSGNIGNKFSERLFNTKVNPFGVIFNPISIFKLLERSIDKKYFNDSDWIFRDEKWLNLDLHGELSFSNLDEALTHSNNIINQIYNFLKTSNYLFLTFGTAWVYSFKEKNQLVANCHKIPQKEFEKKILSVSEIVEYGKIVLDKLQNLNSNVQTVLTISPVRHWADGAHNNNISKSTLHLSVIELLKHNKTAYFPSYELVIDELRDYRFYDKDLVHPNEIATDFVWEKLSENWLKEETIKEIQEIEKVILSAHHRPFNVESEAHQKFVINTLNKLSQLKTKHPNLDFDELEYLLKIQLR